MWSDNQYVQKGTVLVEIDPKDYEVAVAQAQANLASAEATAQSLNITVPITSVNTASQLKFTASDVASSNAGIIAAEKQVAAAHAQLEQAEANDVKVQDDVRATNCWWTSRKWPRKFTIRRVAAAKASTASIAAAAANEAAAQQLCNRPGAAWRDRKPTSNPRKPRRSKCRQPGIARAPRIADVEQKRAALEQAQLNLQYTKIVAPVSGEVNKTVVVGMNVGSGPAVAHRGAA